MKEVRSVQSLIEEFLLRENIVSASRQSFRTYPITGKELGSQVNKIRLLLKKNKIKKDDKVFLLAANSSDWLSVYFACILSGVIVVPLDVMTDNKFLKKIQSQVKAKAIFQDKGVKLINIRTFYFDDFEMADRSMLSSQYPDCKDLIGQLTVD